MKTKFFLASLILLTLFTATFAADSLQLRGKIGLGFQGSAPTPGLSAKYEFFDPVQVQGIFGIFGDNTYYGGRLLYGFKQPYHTAYIFASGGGWLVRNQETSVVMPGGMYENKKVIQYGQVYGGGFGLEWFFRGLPELGVSFEVGFANYHEPPGTEDSSAMIGGMGLHYYPLTSK